MNPVHYTTTRAVLCTALFPTIDFFLNLGPEIDKAYETFDDNSLEDK